MTKPEAKKEKKGTAFIKAMLWGFLEILAPVLSGVAAGVAKLGTNETLFVQGIFMVLFLMIPLILVISRKWKPKDIGISALNTSNCRKALYFLPVIIIYIPVAIRGFQIKSTPYLLGSIFLYLFVGIVEEVYFRGIVVSYLSRVFGRNGIILLSTLIFGTGHLATAFSGSDALEIVLTVLNAYIFGWLAVEIYLLSGNIFIPIIMHFVFDFETKIIVMNGSELLTAELIRGTLMFILAFWLLLFMNYATGRK